MDRIPPNVWQHPVRGRNLHGSTLAAEIGDDETLLVFLRHLG